MTRFAIGIYGALVVAVAAPGFAQGWFANGQSATLMLSGAGFNNTGGALTFNHPTGVASDGTHFLLCDRFNNRVLIWNSLPTAWNSAPSLALGQPGLTTNDPGTGKGQLNWPGNVSVSSGGVVAVADTENDRILLWKTFPTSNGQAADISLYLPGYTQPGKNRLEWPWGVWTDGTRLAAVATQGSTLLFWNTLPTTDNQTPDYRISLSTFGTPRNISTDGSTYFFVGDHNSKVLGDGPGTFFWNSYPTTTDQPYEFFFNEWLKGTKTPEGKLVAGGLQNIYVWNTMPTSAADLPSYSMVNSYYKNGDGPDVVCAGGRVYVNNYNGNNVHVYSGTPSSATDQPAFALGSASVSANTLDQINYIQNPVLATDGTRLLATSDFDRALWIWKTMPSQSGTAPDVRMSLQTNDLSPWDNALYNGTLVLAGKRSVGIWNSLPLNGEAPTRVLRDQIGSAVFSELKGAALDGQFMYLADRPSTIYVWNGIPTTASENPVRTITLPTSQVNHLHSDGTYLCAAMQGNPPTVYIYRVADIAAQANPQPWKTIASDPALRLNLPSEAITFNGSLAIANTSNNSVLMWKNIADAPDPTKCTVLGQSSVSGIDPAIGQNRLFMPSSMAADSTGLWVGELKFSSRILRFASDQTSAVREWGRFR
ncbi:MAG: hypothetical protein K1X53_06970 [Candidatus Sumerlaeaceae bacterium]|nr:hypothetical protein [Candidatus Sumerlaeaceae bacterium]